MGQQGAASNRAIDRKEEPMDSGGINWSIINIVGPLLLAVVILWALLKNRKSSRAEIDRTEVATRDLYKKEDAAHRDDNTMGT
jgi:hypothetical protein